MNKVLFFINGFAPSDEEREIAEKIKGVVVFRNAQFDPGEGAMEECAGVAGCAPARYVNAFGAVVGNAPAAVVATVKPTKSAPAAVWKPQA